MEIQIPSAQGSSLCNKNNADKKASDKERKIGRYLGKYNLFKANLETKIRSRLNFLKEKVMRNVNEIRRLAQMLFTHKISALPSSDMD